MKTIDSILSELYTIFSRVFENDNITMTESTAVNSIREWDSLNHIQLIVAIEKCFKIKFTDQEMYDFKTVGDMCKAIQEKLPAA